MFSFTHCEEKYNQDYILQENNISPGRYSFKKILKLDLGVGCRLPGKSQ